MPRACNHSRWKVVKRIAATEHREDGVDELDPRKRYRVLDVLRCASCDIAGTRWSRFYGRTERAALKRAGVPEDQLPPPPNYKPKPLAAVATSGWPFPVSAHVERME